METREISKMGNHHPEPYTIPPSGEHKYTLILLHGTSTSGPEFGDSFLDFPFSLSPAESSSSSSLPPSNEKLVENTTLRNESKNGGRLEGVKIVFPTGSLKKTTVFRGKETNAWFDIHTFSDRTIGENDQVPGLRDSLVYLKKLVEDEVKLVGGNKGRVVIGGFSQGSAMVVTGLLSGELNGIGGVVGFSGWLPFRREIQDAMSVGKIEKTERKGRRGIMGRIWEFVLSCLRRVGWLIPWILRRHFQKTTTVSKQQHEQFAKRRKKVTHYVRELLSLTPRDVVVDDEIPILLGHGSADLKVKHEWALQMWHSLMNMGLNLKTRRYEGVEHWYCEEEMRDLTAFLRKVWGLR